MPEGSDILTSKLFAFPLIKLVNILEFIKEATIKDHGAARTTAFCLKCCRF